MERMRLRGLAALVVMAACACKPNSSDDTRYPGARVPGAVPQLFANVPADTPYLLAAIDAVPVEVYARMKKLFEPVFEPLKREWHKENNKVLDAILSELEGKWNQAGLESLGVSAQPRFALYGLGLQPFVARLELKDHKVFRATLERIAVKAGSRLPAAMTRAGRDYWTVPVPGGAKLVISLADNTLTFAVGTTSEIDAKLGLILGDDRPAQNMADGKLVKELMARHGLGPYTVGFADSRRIADAAIRLAKGTQTPACAAEIARVSAKVPRLVFGYSELSPTRISGGMILEVSAETAAALQAVRTSVPALVAAMSARPLMAIGGGVDLARGQQLLRAAVGHLERVGTACDLPALASAGEAMSLALSRSLPEPLAHIAGGAVLVTDIVFGDRKGGAPEKLEAVAVVASPDAKALFARLLKLSPELAELRIPPDGKVHDLPRAKLPLPYAMAAAITDRALVVAVGDKRAALAEQMLRARGTGETPLLAMSYDYGRLLQFADWFDDDSAPDGPLAGEMVASMSRALGAVSMSIDVTPGGLASWSTIELK